MTYKISQALNNSLFGKMLDVGIVGGGPVGLMTALLLAFDNRKITIYEKRQEYSRHHNIRISSEVMEKIFESHPQLKKYLPEWEKGCNVHTSEIENKLKNCLSQISPDITFVNREILSLDDITHDVIIAADGSRSKIRDLLGIEKIDSNNLGYMMSVKFKTEGRTRPRLGVSALFYWIVNSVLGSENIDFEIMSSKNNIEDKSGTLLIKIDKQVYQEIEGKTLKLEDMNNDILKNCASIIKRYKSLSLWWRGGSLKEEKITGLPLSIYRAEKCYKELNGTHYFLVGDSSSGLIYEQGLNKGWKEALMLEKSLNGNYEEYSEKCQNLFNSYKSKISATATSTSAISSLLRVVVIGILAILLITALFYFFFVIDSRSSSTDLFNGKLY